MWGKLALVGLLFGILPSSAVHAQPQTPNAAHESAFEQWIQSHQAKCSAALLDAIGPPGAAEGAILASPSKGEPGEPDYGYFTWIRDGAHVMLEVVYKLERAIGVGDTAQIDFLFNELMSYFRFQRQLQLTSNKSGAFSDRGIGEPKFMLDGSRFDGEWGRPQNDGSPLRALVAMKFARLLPRIGKAHLIEELFYKPELPAGSLIKADLEYTAVHWNEPNFEYWEEVYGKHFCTMLIQWKSLDEGASFAVERGDHGAAAHYRAEAARIRDYLGTFWSPEKKIIRVSREISRGDKGKQSELDIAVLLGVLHTDPMHGLYPVDHPHLISTVAHLEDAFDRIYGVNRTTRDWDGETMAPAIGRYTEDAYTGTHVGQIGEGNPWFLAIHAMAEYYYLMAKKLGDTGSLLITAENAGFFNRLLGSRYTAGQVLTRSNMNFTDLIAKLRARGDQFLRRSRYHTDHRGHQSEQLNRNTGFMQGARDLTWSYASFLSALRARDL